VPTPNISRLLWLAAIYGLAVLPSSAQSTVTISLETERGGGVVTQAKVNYRLVKEGPKAGSKREVLEEGDIPEDSGRFIAQRLPKGFYQFVACDDGLKFEPAVIEVRLGNNDSRTLTLELNDLSVRQPVTGMAVGSQVCLIHLETGCKASREVKKDQKGKTYIEYRGLNEHFTVEPQACR
jgi:hypothetical protein